MPIPFTCPGCQKTGHAPDSFAGKRVKCKCGYVLAFDDDAAIVNSQVTIHDDADVSKSDQRSGLDRRVDAEPVAHDRRGGRERRDGPARPPRRRKAPSSSEAHQPTVKPTGKVVVRSCVGCLLVLAAIGFVGSWFSGGAYDALIGWDSKVTSDASYEVSNDLVTITYPLSEWPPPSISELMFYVLSDVQDIQEETDEQVAVFKIRFVSERDESYEFSTGEISWVDVEAYAKAVDVGDDSRALQLFRQIRSPF